MTTIEIAPLKPRDQWVKSITTPTGSYYMVGYPTVKLAEELVDLGIERLVFVASENPCDDWFEAQKLLVEAGVEITAHWET